MIKIHPIETGKVRVKQFQVTGGTNIISRLWQLFFTNRWSDWYPIYCWLVEHPEGPFLIDVGEIAKVHEPGFLLDSMGFRSSVQYAINREDEIDCQLDKLGFDLERIKAIFLTHLHGDHADGLYHFQGVRIYVSQLAYDGAMGPNGKSIGYLKKNLPDWFHPHTFKYDDENEDVFGPGHRMTRDGTIVAVPLPGHAPGHTGYIVKTKSARYICAGDAVFDRSKLHDGIPFVVLNNASAIESVRKLREYTLSPDVVLLCSHDPHVSNMLKANQVEVDPYRSIKN